MHTTNYIDTFIEVADDSPTDHAVEPPTRDRPSVAQLHYEIISSRPYTLTSDDILFETHALRTGISPGDRDTERERFFSKGQPCLRSSPLGKRYGWGVHSDAEGRVAIYARESDDYRRLAADPGTAHTRAMRSKRS